MLLDGKVAVDDGDAEFVGGDVEGLDAALAQARGYEIDARQELLGLGAANLAAGLFQAYPVAGGLSQSSVNDKAGARTPLALVFASVTQGALPKFFVAFWYGHGGVSDENTYPIPSTVSLTSQNLYPTHPIRTGRLVDLKRTHAQTTSARMVALPDWDSGAARFSPLPTIARVTGLSFRRSLPPAPASVLSIVPAPGLLFQLLHKAFVPGAIP